MPEEFQGGNSRASGQSLLISKNAEALKSYQRAMSQPNPIPEDMLDAWARRMVDLEPYIEARAKEAGARYLHGTGWSERGVVLEFPEYGAAEAVQHSATILPVPSGVWLTFAACVRQRPRIRVQFETPIVDLVQDPDSLEVFGAIVTVRGERRAIRARRGVVMCTGGFENNLQMQRDYFGLSEIHPLGTPGNTGDGRNLVEDQVLDLAGRHGHLATAEALSIGKRGMCADRDLVLARELDGVEDREDAIARGDRNAAVAALKLAEPELMRAAQRGVTHKNTASRKVSRLTKSIAGLAK
jgi:hypothetical protein